MKPVNAHSTQLYFKDPAWVALWNEELCGQISDGAWENSRKTEWLWEDCVCVQGEENKIVVSYYQKVGRRGYEFFEELDCVHDRMMEYIKKVNPEYTIDDLKKICDGIKKFIKTADIKIDRDIYSRDQRHEEIEKQNKDQRIRDFAEDFGFEKKYGTWSLKVADKYYSTIKIKDVRENGKAVVNIDDIPYSVTKEQMPEFIKAVENLSKFLC